MNCILLTGASGFVGRALFARLRNNGGTVRAAVRAYAADARISDQAIAVGDIGPDTDWSKALSGCDAVVHLAARVHVMQPGASAADYFRVNVEGSEQLARSAAAAGVRRFVFLSSVKVNGEATEGRPFSESDPPAPVDDYAVSKMRAEACLRRIAAETGMEVVALRPPLVYGPGVRANFLSLLRVVEAGLPLPLASVANLRSLIYVGNLVSAIETCIHHPAAAGNTYFVTDDDDVSTPELIRRIAAALGRSPRLFPLPVSLLEGAAALFGRRAQVQRLTASLQMDVSRIKSELRWTPPVTMQQGLMETASWYRTRSA
jgi:nucleoside-diphosphate-sugar epimerase